MEGLDSRNFDLLLSGWDFSRTFYPPLPSVSLSSGYSLLRVVRGVAGVVSTRLLGGVLNLDHGLMFLPLKISFSWDRPAPGTRSPESQLEQAPE
jgi:hypothetical protein